MLTLGAENLNIMKWHIDSSHAVHADMRGQTGLAMTLGKGSIINDSGKQKMNTRSSVETELMGQCDMIYPEVTKGCVLACAGGHTESNLKGTQLLQSCIFCFVVLGGTPVETPTLCGDFVCLCIDGADK